MCTRVGASTWVLVLKSALSTFFQVLGWCLKPFFQFMSVLVLLLEHWFVKVLVKHFIMHFKHKYFQVTIYRCKVIQAIYSMHFCAFYTRGLLNCPNKCIDTPRSKYRITILNGSIDISIFRYVLHITRQNHIVIMKN